MKQILIGVLLLSFMACSQKPLEKGKYRINGEVVGMGNGEIYLSKYPAIDTIKVTNGKFLIEDKLDGIVGQIGLIKDPAERGMTLENVLYLFIEPKIMTLQLNYNDFSKSKLSGSNTQDDAYRLDQIRNEIAQNYTEEQKAFDQVSERFLAAKKAKASAKEIEAIKNEDNVCREKLQPMWDKQNNATLEFIKNNPKSYVSVYSLVFQLGDMKYDEAKAIYDQFNPEHLKIGMATRLASDIANMKKGIPGAEAGDFNTTDINGKPIKLADFKGKYVLIDFWASWCGPCRAGNPHLIDIYHKYHHKGLEILGVSDDDSNPAAWRKAVEKDQIGIWHHVLRGSSFDRKTMKNKFPEKDISDGYNIHTLPTKILVGPDGIILGRFGSGGGNDHDMDKMLADLFKNKQ